MHRHHLLISHRNGYVAGTDLVQQKYATEHPFREIHHLDSFGTCSSEEIVWKPQPYSQFQCRTFIRPPASCPISQYPMLLQYVSVNLCYVDSKPMLPECLVSWKCTGPWFGSIHEGILGTTKWPVDMISDFPQPTLHTDLAAIRTLPALQPGVLRWGAILLWWLRVYPVETHHFVVIKHYKSGVHGLLPQFLHLIYLDFLKSYHAYSIHQFKNSEREKGAQSILHKKTSIFISFTCSYQVWATTQTQNFQPPAPPVTRSKGWSTRFGNTRDEGKKRMRTKPKCRKTEGAYISTPVPGKEAGKRRT